jgi:hypothetical protein
LYSYSILPEKEAIVKVISAFELTGAEKQAKVRFAYPGRRSFFLSGQSEVSIGQLMAQSL